MNTIAITASTNTILAIALGEYKSVACLYRSNDDARLVFRYA